MATKKAPVPAPTDERHDLAALPIPAVDPSAALAAAATVAKHLAEPKTRARFDALPDEEVNHALVAAHPALHEVVKRTAAAYQSAENAEGDALVPESTVKVLTAIRARTTSLIEYYLGDDPEVARELIAIRAGTGYKDLANDVVALLGLCSKHLSVIKHDKKNYRAEDATEGPVHVEIVREARLKGQRPATKKAARAWANAFYALRESHDEVTEVGRFIDRRRADKDERWPSLYVNVKRSGKRKGGGGGNGEGI
jgi:hypothetical protein